MLLGATDCWGQQLLLTAARHFDPQRLFKREIGGPTFMLCQALYGDILQRTLTDLADQPQLTIGLYRVAWASRSGPEDQGLPESTSLWKRA